MFYAANSSCWICSVITTRCSRAPLPDAPAPLPASMPRRLLPFDRPSVEDRAERRPVLPPPVALFRAEAPPAARACTSHRPSLTDTSEYDNHMNF